MSDIIRKAVGLGSNGFSKHNRLTGVVMSNYIVVNGIRIASDFEPETFGRLTTIGPRFIMSDSKGRIHSYQVCQCQCGNIKVIRTGGLGKGTQSCGCLNKEIITKHGHYKHNRTSQEAQAYIGMVSRCTNPKNPAYRHYGGRGIKVASEWLGPGGFERWLAYIGPKPSPELSVERDNVNGNYEPGNVRWATIKEQNDNKRNTVLLTYNGETKTQAQWARDMGMSPTALWARLKRGWSVAKALSYPIRQIKRC